MTGGRAVAGMAASGLLLMLAFPEPDVAPLAWISLAPALHLTRGTPVRRALALWFVFGVAFFGSLLLWISLVGWLPWLILVLLQATFLAAFGAGWSIVGAHPARAVRVLAAASLWVAVEAARAFVPILGFTWGQLAQSQHGLPWLLRPAGFGGGWAVAFVLVAANALLGEAVASARGRRRVAPALGAASLIAAPLLLPSPVADGRLTRIAIVQGNVPRDFAGGQYEKELTIARSHAKLTERLGAGIVDLVVWPESSVGLDPFRDRASAEAMERAAVAARAPMLVGGNVDVDDDRYHVVIFEVSPTGDLVDRYQKTHLVPFGEYVPARRLLAWIPMLDQVPRDAVAGEDVKVFDIAGGKVGSVISFEGDFGPLVRKRVDSGGRLVVVATNTSTWGTSWASAQHVAFSQVRAAENGVWVVHAALSGISAFIQPDGTIAAATDLFTAQTLTRDVRFATEITFYARVGEWLPLSCALLSVVGMILGRRARDSHSP